MCSSEQLTYRGTITKEWSFFITKMSSQPPQRSRRNASPRAGPQPMRATLPVTLQVRQSSPTRASNGRRSSPALASSPTQPWTTGENHKVKHRRSPDHRASPERSPSSPGFRGEGLVFMGFFLSTNYSQQSQDYFGIFVEIIAALLLLFF